MRLFVLRTVLTLFTGIAVAASCQPTNAGVLQLGVTPITSNSGLQVALAGQLKILVADEAVDLQSEYGIDFNGPDSVAAPGAGQLNFIFVNLGAIASSIADVYFDDGTLLGIASLTSSSGVSFSQGGAPPNLPGGNSITPKFDTTAGFLADSDSPVAPNGVNPGEWLSVTFNLLGGQDFDDVVNALNLGYANGAQIGALRIGLHVQSIGPGGESDSFINTPDDESDDQMVPEPTSLALLASGALGAVVIGRRRRRQAA